MLILSDEEKPLVKDALMISAERYVELARTKIKLDGHPMKSSAGLVEFYFKKADRLSEISVRIK